MFVFDIYLTKVIINYILRERGFNINSSSLFSPKRCVTLAQTRLVVFLEESLSPKFRIFTYNDISLIIKTF